jgi:hypothetical protein
VTSNFVMIESSTLGWARRRGYQRSSARCISERRIEGACRRTRSMIDRSLMRRVVALTCARDGPLACLGAGWRRYGLGSRGCCG